METSKRVSCGSKRESFLKHFPYSRESILEMAESEIQCKKYCGAKTNCFACVHKCDEKCQWTAVDNCDEKDHLNRRMAMNVSIKPGKLCFLSKSET